MKLKYLFSAVLASVLMVGCNDEDLGTFDNIKIEESYLSLPSDGGSVELTINSTDAWEFVQYNDKWPNIIERNKDKSIKSETPSWLTADKMSGSAGETKVKFTAAAFDGGREVEVKIKAGGNSQFVRIRQGSMVAVPVTCAEANASNEGKNVKVKGFVKSINNTEYGNMYIYDETGEVFIYGTLDKDGKEKNFSSLKIEVGDEITVEGPVAYYNGNPRLKNVTVVKIKKSLIKIDDNKTTVSKDGGEIAVRVAYKGKGVFPAIPEDCDWIEYVGMEYKNGVPTKLEQSPADTAIVKFSVAANEGNNRECMIIFTSYKAEKKDDGKLEVVSSDAVFTVNQELGLNFAPLPFEETFKGTLGAFTINDVILPTGSTYVWKSDNSYAKASSFVNKTNLASESWLISPLIDLTSENPTLSFEHALNYVNSDKPENHISVMARTLDGEWSELTGYTYPSGKNWTFVESGSIDLKAYSGTKFQFAFRYVGSTTAAPTWEIKNVSVK